MAGRMLHLGQVVVDLTLYLRRLPERGGDVFADQAGMQVGGGYNVLYAARRFGADAVYCGGLGEGGMADMCREALREIGVPAVGPLVAGVDQGYSVAMTEPSGERTFVSTRGAETMIGADSYSGLDVGAEDVVYLSGYSYAHEKTTRALWEFARGSGAGVGRALFDVGPMVGDMMNEDLEVLRERVRPVWTVNEREAGILLRRLRMEARDPGEAAQRLCGELRSAVIVRVGADGAWVAPGVGAAGAVHVPSIAVRAVDTNGAGDAHSGVLAAALLEGLPLVRAVRLANVAGALSTTVAGPATAPTREEIERLA